MTIHEAYERYKHMDHLLSNREWLSADFNGMVLNDLWQAIKAEQSAICSRCAAWKPSHVCEWGDCLMVEEGSKVRPAWLSHQTLTRLSTMPDFGCTEHVTRTDIQKED